MTSMRESGMDDTRAPAAGPWVADGSRAAEPAGAPRLFCFAHAGGGPALFRPWRERLAPDVVVQPVQLLGREARISEPPFRRMADLIDPLCEALAPRLIPP